MAEHSTESTNYAVVGETKIGKIDLKPEKLMNKASQDPIVIIAGMGVVGALGYGLAKFVQGTDPRGSNNMMKARVSGQMCAVGAAACYGLYAWMKTRKTSETDQK